ncbi:MAG TPA: hypothetical protein VKE40_15200 [Gemmataceae bacterium]|nr:hypothetical protein [Gemmataceae bacterium]
MNRQNLLNVILIACTIASLGTTVTLARRLDAAEQQLRQLTDRPDPPTISARPRTLPMPD